ncbi:hypothetical protein HMPREF9075_00503 [Capnocytophaga sp. oral taxon 332 str. F0381]|nr:hypothetical protein HMPREF9075_00503 [Capnocytophaga sp. oral taxon 332 str. F0381]
MTKNKNLTLWIVKFNTILTMGGGNFTYLCKDFTMGVGRIMMNFEL